MKLIKRVDYIDQREDRRFRKMDQRFKEQDQCFIRTTRRPRSVFSRITAGDQARR